MGKLGRNIRNEIVISMVGTLAFFFRSSLLRIAADALFMEIGKKSLSPLKLTLTLRAKDGMGREWKLAWVKANED